MGQDARINVHLCLRNCAGAQLSVAGSLRNYSDGRLLAFEDRADHEIWNPGVRDRLSLTVGVLHPDLQIEEPYLSPQQILRFALAEVNVTTSHLPPKTTTAALILAAFYGYAGAAQQLLAHGADPNGLNMAGLAAVHAAILGVARDDDARYSHADRVRRAVEVIEVLAEQGAADLELPVRPEFAGSAGVSGTAAEIAARMRLPRLKETIDGLSQKRGSKRGRKRGSKRGSKRGRKRGGGNQGCTLLLQFTQTCRPLAVAVAPPTPRLRAASLAASA